MKKAFFALMYAVLLSPLAVGAWVMSSSPFVFPSVSTISGDHKVASLSELRGNYDAAKGIVLFRYALPSTAKSATLNIYNVAGIKVKSFDLLSGSTMVSWHFAQNSCAAGIYMVSMQIGSSEKTTQISIVK
jgi:hypothetical protein